MGGAGLPQQRLHVLIGTMHCVSPQARPQGPGILDPSNMRGQSNLADCSTMTFAGHPLSVKTLLQSSDDVQVNVARLDEGNNLLVRIQRIMVAIIVTACEQRCWRSLACGMR